MNENQFSDWKVGRLFVFGFTLFFGLSIPSSSAQDNCVTCHEKLSPETFVGHSFSDWQDSIHQKKAVSCHACHGGNPQAADFKEAHEGILSSTDRDSPLYFTHIPQMCGSCHTDVLTQFKKSSHYNELQKSGRGPNCLTCHGSMATWILRPEQMEQTCSLCHAKPMKAQAALTFVRLAESKVDRLLKSMPAEKVGQKRYQSLKTELENIFDLWHSFDMDVVLKRSRALIRRVQQVSTDLKLGPAENQKEKSK